MEPNQEQSELNSQNTSKFAFPVAEQLFLLGIVLFLLFGVGYISQYISMLEEEEKLATSQESRAQRIQNKDPDHSPEEDTIDPYQNVRLRAKSAIVWDIQKQEVLFQIDADTPRPLASITKLMTTVVAHELIENDKNISVQADALAQDGNSNLALNEHFSMEDLSDLTLITSSNDGAYALASAAGSLLSSNDPARTFVSLMNIRADELGLFTTDFKNPTGLDISERESGADGSARDVARLMEYILLNYPSLLLGTTESSTVIYSSDGQLHDAQNTNQMVEDIPSVIGSKTGFTDLAGGNLALAFNAGLDRPIVVVVLGSGYQERFADVSELVERTQEYLNQ